MDNKRRFSIFLLLVILFVFCFGAVSAAKVQTNSLLVKVAVKEGSVTDRVVSVSSAEGGQFKVETVGLKGVTFGESDFTLQSNQNKDISVKLDANVAGKGAHIGSVKITSGADVQLIPVIFEVESREVLFDINLDVAPEYTEIQPGGRFIAQLKIYDLTWGGTSEGMGPTNVDVEYYVYGIDGTLVSSEVDSIVVNRQTQVTKNLDFPSNANKGDYVFVAVAKYKTSLGSSTAMFSVSKKSGSLDLSSLSFDFSSITGFFQNGIVIIILVFGIFFLMILFLFVYLVSDRDKLLVEMRKFNAEELKDNKKLLFEQQRLLSNRQPARTDEIKQEIRGKLKMLEEEHKQREKTLSKLKSAGNPEQMKRQLKIWRAQGYNTFPLEYKLKGLTKEEMSSLLKKWKKKYKS